MLAGWGGEGECLVYKGKQEEGSGLRTKRKGSGFSLSPFPPPEGLDFAAGQGWTLFQDNVKVSVGILWSSCPNSKPTLRATRPSCRQKTKNKQTKDWGGRSDISGLFRITFFLKA